MEVECRIQTNWARSGPAVEVAGPAGSGFPVDASGPTVVAPRCMAIPGFLAGDQV